MSESQIDWERVAREIVKTLGLETARGLYWAFLIQGIYPLVQRTIVETFEKARGKGMGQEEAWREIAMKLAELQSKQPLAPPSKSPMTENELVAQLATQLRNMQGQMAGPGSSVIQPPVSEEARLKTRERIKALEERIRTLEDVENELLKRKFTTLDEKEVEKIEQRLKEVREYLRKLREELEFYATWG